MTDAGLRGDLRPVPAAPFQRRPDFDIKLSAHAETIAKLCESGKQQIARQIAQSLTVPNRTLNQTLGANLRALMDARGLTAQALGRKAGVAPNTVGNYLKAADPDADNPVTPAKGKERSAKLAEVEKLAIALQVDPLELLSSKAGPVRGVRVETAPTPRIVHPHIKRLAADKSARMGTLVSTAQQISDEAWEDLLLLAINSLPAPVPQT